jgi:type II secretory pathway pseudopilin PulG
MWKRTRRRAGRTGAAGSGGFTLAELALAMTMLIVALISISAATLRSHSLRRQNRERTLAHNAIRSTAERIHSLAYTTVETTPSTWVQDLLARYGPGGTIGNAFDVEGLNPVGANGRVGSIQIVTDETQTDAALGAELGMPRDLNGDGDANDNVAGGTARLLPVVITVTYRAATGSVTMNHAFYVVGF